AGDPPQAEMNKAQAAQSRGGGAAVATPAMRTLLVFIRELLSSRSAACGATSRYRPGKLACKEPGRDDVAGGRRKSATSGLFWRRAARGADERRVRDRT